MTTTEIPPKDLGYVPFEPPSATPKQSPFIPRALRFVTYGLSNEEALANYGTYRMKILPRDYSPDKTGPCVSLGFGRYASPGQNVELRGDVAMLLVAQGQATWSEDDPRIKEEFEKIKLAKELGLDTAGRTKIVSSPQREKPKTGKWMQGLGG